jgi:RNA polymerase sigma factor (sigma-70 family)
MAHKKPLLTAAQLDLFERELAWAEGVGRSLHERYGSINGCERDDFTSLAAIGLTHAVRGDNPARGKFHPHAYKIVRGYVLDEIRKIDDVGRYQRDQGKAPKTVSLDGPAHSGVERVALMRDALAAPDEFLRLDAYDAVSAIMAGLPVSTRAVLYLRHVGELTRWEAGAVLGLSAQAVAAIESAPMAFFGHHKSPPLRVGRSRRQPRGRQLWLFAQEAEGSLA